MQGFETLEGQHARGAGAGIGSRAFPPQHLQGQ
jgi:hypothetical protein